MDQDTVVPDAVKTQKKTTVPATWNLSTDTGKRFLIEDSILIEQKKA